MVGKDEAESEEKVEDEGLVVVGMLFLPRLFLLFILSIPCFLPLPFYVVLYPILFLSSSSSSILTHLFSVS